LEEGQKNNQWLVLGERISAELTSLSQIEAKKSIQIF
jgi:hypothetical protein